MPSASTNEFVERLPFIFLLVNFLKRKMLVVNGYFAVTGRIFAIRDLKIPRYRCTGTGSVPVHVKCSCA